jgi:hypothetical protein
MLLPVSETETETGTSPWCAGLRLAGRRALTDAERRELRLRGGLLGALGFLALGSSPLLFVFFLISLALNADADGMPGPVGIFLVTAMLPLMAVVLVLGRRWVRWYRTVRRDARAGVAYRFEGAMDGLFPGAELRDRLQKERLLPLCLRGTQCLEVLPESGLVWSVNGIRPRRSISAPTAHVAEVPAIARIAAEWLEPVAPADEVTAWVGQRELAAAEADEIRLHAARVVRPSLVWGTGLTLWLGFLLGLAVRAGQLPTGWHGALLAILAMAALHADITLLRSLRLSWELRRDSRLRRAVIVRSPVPHLNPEEPERETTLSEPEEYLPVSSLVWTKGGRPAAWRTVR